MYMVVSKKCIWGFEKLKVIFMVGLDLLKLMWKCLQGSVIMASAQSCTHTTIQMFDDEEEEKAMIERQNIDDRSATSYVRSIIIVLILSYINLVIYMDSFTESGVMPNLQSHFKMESSGLGLKNTVPICSQVLADHVFGYLGDRFNRKNIMCAGMSFWAIMNLCITFIPNEYFHLFLEMRRLLGVLKACFSTMAPSIIADLFVGRQRGCMLSIYYFTAPVGCGLGFIIASTVTRAAGGDWHWAFRVTPGLGLIAVLLIISFVKEPHREIFDRNNNKLPICKTWMMDIKHLLKNKSFMLSTFGNANVTFVTAAITFWAPSFLMLSGAVTKQKEPCQTDVCNYHDRYKFSKP
ncbi:protein spinster homolog 1-like [Ranitomeya imitator]|uniref:protein spinster homolog 1-like n=1 Tax=Ranitomeya imitator TaxID=111125 RepID=UPI0037E834A3